MLYRECLDEWKTIRESLDSWPITGPFRRLGQHRIKDNWRWHYSGTFFWFRNRDVFERPEWNEINEGFFGCVEAWPGHLFHNSEVGCTFGDNCGLLYEDRELSHWEGEGRDREFFKHPTNVKMQTTEWPGLVNLHSRGVLAVKSLGCQSVLEIGSGLGPFLLASQEAGLDAVGMDRSRFERDFAVSKGVDPDTYILNDISRFQIMNGFDCILSIEVFEHCTDDVLEPLVRQIAEHCKWFYFTSTPHPDPDHDAEWGHVNIKQKHEWIEFFAHFGLIFEREDRSVVEWGMVFKGKIPVETQKGEMILIRHGEKEIDVGLSHDLNCHLTDRGKQQAAECGRKMSQMDLSGFKFVVSPYRRCLDTAEEISKVLGVQFEVDTSIREIGPDTSVDGVMFHGEDESTFLERMRQVFANYKSQQTVIVSHGGPIAVLSLMCGGEQTNLGGRYWQAVPNAEPLRFELL